MKALILSETPHLIFPLISVVLFTGIFVAVVAWVMRPGSKAEYARRSAAILDDDEVIHG